MSTTLPRLANLRRAMSATPWAIMEDKLHAILDVVEHHASGHGYTPDQLQAIEAQVQARATRSSTVASGGSIAVIPIHGAITQRAGMFSAMSGGCSTEEIGAALEQAMADSKVGAIVLDCDSPGGSVSGVPELAAKLYGMRGQGKSITAVANGLMASAAYWICSAADEIVVTPSGDVGSIGVFGVHTDVSKADEQDGIKRTLVKAGKYKAEGNPFSPLSEEAHAALQSSVDDLYGMFVADVAKYRGVAADDVLNGYGEGRCLAAKRAVKAGLADRVATLDSVLATLGASSSGTVRRAAVAPVQLAATSTFGSVPLAGTYVGTLDLLTAPHLVTRTIDTGGGAPLASLIIPESHRPHEAKEHTVENSSNTAAHTGADTTGAVAQERVRVSQIMALCAEHDVNHLADGFITAGATVDAASRQILTVQRDARKAGAVVQVGATREAAKPWLHFGEQVSAVIGAMSPGRQAESPDVRLFGAATGMNQAIPSEGGFTVAPQFSQIIWDGLNEERDNLISMTDNYTVEGESLTFNANAETSRATGSRFGGVRGYWINEADQITSSRPKFRAVKIEPQQLAALIYLTEKLQRNSGVALGQYVTRAATEEIGFLANLAIFSGTGAGQPKGFADAACTVSVSKEANQPAATIVQANITKMWARLHPRSRRNAVWLHNVDVEPQLDALNSTVTNIAGTENVGGYANKVFDPERRTLKGRPLVACEFSETLGTKNDLVLADLSGYITGTRGGVESAMSMHLRFDYAEQALRFIFEIDGQPWLASALTPFKGSNTLSTFVTLATRA